MLFTQKGEMTKILQYYPDIQTQNVFARNTFKSSNVDDNDNNTRKWFQNCFLLKFIFCKKVEYIHIEVDFEHCKPLL
jgi:hypothetical protein